jgi:hypothetical protein
MHEDDFRVSSDRKLLALRDGDHALVADTEFDPVFGYFYVADCRWYRSDLARIEDDEVPDATRHELLRRFRVVLS